MPGLQRRGVDPQSAVRGNSGKFRQRDRCRSQLIPIALPIDRAYKPPLAHKSSAFKGMFVARNSWPVIIGGCHRSGTSLVRRIINAHSRFFCGPEIKFFRDLHGDYLGDPVRHGRFFHSAQVLCTPEKLLELFGPAYIALLRQAADHAGKPRWADKNPENVLYLSQWERLLGNDWLFLQVARHPLDTLASIKEVRFPYAIPAGLDERIAFYLRYIEAGLEFGKAYPERHFLLRYEELVRAPQEMLDRLMAWTGEAFEVGQLTYNSFPQPRGLEDPKVDRCPRIHGDSIGRWHEMLTPQEARLIWAKTRDLWATIDQASCDQTDREFQPRLASPSAAAGLLHRLCGLVRRRERVVRQRTGKG